MIQKGQGAMKIKNSHYRLLLQFLTLLLLPELAWANLFYTGVQLGESKINSSNLNVQSLPSQSNPNTLVSGPADVDIDNEGFAGRAYVGTQFTPYIALEGGYTQFAGVKIKNIYGIAGKDEQLNEGAIDTVLKLTLPLGNGVSLYGTGGEAFVMTDQISSAEFTTSSTVNLDSNTVDRFRPTYGFGLDYAIARFMSANFSFSRIIGGSDIPTSDLLALGISLYLPTNSPKPQ
ncbi:MAG: outer membrane beta-barrel protein [Gammaproteobacteria bacterium]|nr:outer membrane beta-barrel protein [Gammaproteobacteria bacterium]